MIEIRNVNKVANLITQQSGNTSDVIRNSHLTCKVAIKCLHIHKQAEVAG